MVTLVIDGQKITVEEGTTLLEAARDYGVFIPTLCHVDGLSEYSACRLCVVEVYRGKRSRLAAACSFPVQDGIEVRTNSDRVVRARKVIIELMLASTPNSRTVQCLASEYGVTEIRFKGEDRRCLLCGLCVRVCDEQMGGGAIGFARRGIDREVTMPFHKTPKACRECGACMYICPVCELPCTGELKAGELCNRCVDELRIDAFPSKS